MSDEGTNLSHDKLLSIEVVGNTFALHIPDDVVLAQHMLTELTYQMKKREINQAYKLREQMQAMQGQPKNGIHRPSQIDVARVKRHRAN